MTRVSITIVSLLLLGGCVNPYRANFHSTREQLPSWIEPRLGAAAGKPRLITTENIRQGNWELFEKGYVMVGFSKFDGPGVDSQLALDNAERIGADIVLVEKEFTKTLTETVAVTEWPPSETTEIRESGTSGRGRRVDRRIEVTTHRGPETTYVPKQTDYYEHSATYWRRLERPIFGAFVEELSDALKQKLQTNRGVVVRAVMADSPAYEADLLKDDIVLRMDGEPVPSVRKFYETIVSRAGTSIELTVRRGAKTFQRRVPLRP